MMFAPFPEVDCFSFYSFIVHTGTLIVVFLFLTALVNCWCFLFFLFSQFSPLLRTTGGPRQKEAPGTTWGPTNRRHPGQQEVPVTTGGTPEQQEAPGTTGGAGTTGAPRTTGGNWDNCASSLCPDCAYLCFTQGGMGIFCTGRLLIVVLFLAALPWLIIVFVLLLLFFEILQTDCTTSIFCLCCHRMVGWLFLFCFTANVLGHFFLTLFLFKTRTFSRGDWDPGHTLTVHWCPMVGGLFSFVMEKANWPSFFLTLFLF